MNFPSDKYTPMALGPLGRGWPQRARFAGTYYQQWLDDVFPFLPKDFDERYYQAAPEDQQVPLPKAPMEVVLNGFTADGVRQFMLPHFEAPVHVFPKRGDREEHVATLDTIVFEPDLERFTMSWRVARPLKKSMHEIAQVLTERIKKLFLKDAQDDEELRVAMVLTATPREITAQLASGEVVSVRGDKLLWVQAALAATAPKDLALRRGAVVRLMQAPAVRGKAPPSGPIGP